MRGHNTRRPLLLLITVSLTAYALLDLSDPSASLDMVSQPILDIHTEPDTSTHGIQFQGQEKKNTTMATTKYLFRYKTLGGYFLQDDPGTSAKDFEFTKTNFGLISRAYDSDKTLPDGGKGMTDWQRFEHHLTKLNEEAAQKAKENNGSAAQVITQYKLLFLGRHGNGYHNIAERYYGSEAWDCHYSLLDGDPDGIIVWSDAHLSKEGLRQARDVNEFWKKQMAEEKMSLPQAYYVSPLDRALETHKVSYDGLVSPFEPIVMERLREGTGLHTCDRRSSLSYIRKHYPTYNTTRDRFLTEADELFEPKLREPDEKIEERLGKLLDQIMAEEKNERISLTSHSGAIGAMLHVLGHRQFSVATGAVIPVLVQVDKIAVPAAPAVPGETKRDPLSPRHGGKAEGGSHAAAANKADNDNVSATTTGDSDSDLSSFPLRPDVDEIDDKSTWNPAPPCPPGLDLANVGFERKGMSIKDFVAGVENGTIQLEEVAFRSNP